jgi:hypothetical protein
MQKQLSALAPAKSFNLDIIMKTLDFDCLPICLRPIADYIKSDDMDSLLIIFALIGALSAVAGHHVNAICKYPNGNPPKSIPITVSNIILANSGAGKGRLSDVVFGGIEEWKNAQDPAYKKAMKKYKREMKKLDSLTFKNEAFTEGEIPDEPVSPNFFIKDFTVESIIRKFYIGSRHLFIFSDEGAAVINCRAFQPGSIGTTLPLFNQIHCGETYTKDTKQDGEYNLIKKRITLLVMVQKEAYEELMKKFAASGIGPSGTYQRIFPIRTESRRVKEKKEGDAGFVEIKPKEKTPECMRAQQMLVNMCARKPPVDEYQHLNPPQIHHSPGAHKIWCDFYHEHNDFCSDNPKSETYSYRVRVFETAARYAALFQVGDSAYNNHPSLHSAEITEENMRKAIEICKYGLACQIKEFVNRNEELENAEKLLAFIGEQTVARRKIMQTAPRYFRNSKDLDKVLAFLLEEGLVKQVENGFKKR